MSQTATLQYATPGDPETRGEARLYGGLSTSAWLSIGTIALLLVLTFHHNLVRLWLKTNPFSGEPNWGHAFVVPLIGLYYLFLNREALAKTPAHHSWAGLPILMGGLLLFAYAIWPGQNDFLKDFGMVVAIFGVVLLLAGWRVMKIAWFPIVFLICAIPWPLLVYQKLAWPLQKLAASVAVLTLKITGVAAVQVGTKIYMENAKPLNVAEACAGLRSLMTFISLAAAMAFLSSRQLWQRIIITFCAIPIAIFCNVMRVTGQGLLHKHVSEQLSESFAHQFVGLIMLIPAFFLLLLVGWILDNMFVEEADARSLPSAKGARKVAKAAKADQPKAVAKTTSAPASGSAGASPSPSVARAATAAPSRPTPAPAADGSNLADATRRLTATRSTRPAGNAPARPHSDPSAPSEEEGR